MAQFAKTTTLSPYDLRAYAPQHVAGFLRLKVSWQSMSRYRPFPTLLLGMHFHRGRDHDEIIEMLLSKSLHRGISKKHLNIALTLAQCNGPYQACRDHAEIHDGDGRQVIYTNAGSLLEGLCRVLA